MYYHCIIVQAVNILTVYHLRQISVKIWRSTLIGIPLTIMSSVWWRYEHFIAFDFYICLLTCWLRSVCRFLNLLKYELFHDKSNKMACVSIEDSDQPGHTHSLIRVFAVRMKKPWDLSYPLSTLRRLIRLAEYPGWSESSLGAQIVLLVLSCGGSYGFDS